MFLCDAPDIAGSASLYDWEPADQTYDALTLNRVLTFVTHADPPTNNVDAASFWLTFLKLTLDPGLDITSGNLTVSGVSAATIIKTNDYLNMVLGGTWSGPSHTVYGYTIKPVGNVPAQFFFTDTQIPIPEPATFLLLGGLALLLGLYREMQNKPWLRMCFERQRRK
jgi:hypothetical protein